MDRAEKARAGSRHVVQVPAGSRSKSKPIDEFTLNRLGFSTGCGNAWKKHLVCSLRSKINLPTHDPSNKQAEVMLTAEQAAERLGVSLRTVRELLRTNVLIGKQVIKFAPWQIPVEALKTAAALERVQRIHDGKQPRMPQMLDSHTLRLPGM
jgi:hypothetical protein